MIGDCSIRPTLSATRRRDASGRSTKIVEGDAGDIVFIALQQTTEFHDQAKVTGATGAQAMAPGRLSTPVRHRRRRRADYDEIARSAAVERGFITL
jgi:hypothetical protein